MKVDGSESREMHSLKDSGVAMAAVLEATGQLVEEEGDTDGEGWSDSVDWEE